MQQTLDLCQLNRGKVVSVRGSVIDVRFSQQLPDVYSRLVAGENQCVVMEVMTHLDAETVRGIALTPTSGLARGSVVINTGHPLQVPVGKRLLGRMFNVFGETIDRKVEISGG